MNKKEWNKPTYGILSSSMVKSSGAYSTPYPECSGGGVAAGPVTPVAPAVACGTGTVTTGTTYTGVVYCNWQAAWLGGSNFPAVGPAGASPVGFAGGAFTATASGGVGPTVNTNTVNIPAISCTICPPGAMYVAGQPNVTGNANTATFPVIFSNTLVCS